MKLEGIHMKKWIVAACAVLSLGWGMTGVAEAAHDSIISASVERADYEETMSPQDIRKAIDRNKEKAYKAEQKALKHKKKTAALKNEGIKEEQKEETSVQKAEAKAKPRFEDKRIEINLASRLLTLYQGDVGIRMYPVAPGKPDSPTPEGRRTVVDMEINPEWIDPDDPKNIIPSGPDCPIGYRWIGIGGNYGIHGTNNPYSIGTYASHGCVRMYEKDVEDLFAHIVKGIPVDIIYERVVVQKAPDHTVVYYIYPDGYHKEPLDITRVKAKLAPFGVAAYVSDEDIQKAIDASDGNPHYIVKTYDLYVNGKKLEARAFGKDGKIYIPIMPVARAAGIRVTWSPNWQMISSEYGKVPAVLKNRSLLIEEKDLETLLHLKGNLDTDYNYVIE